MSLPWPKKGQKLFKSSSNYFQYAHFGWGDVDQQFYGYIKGYKEAADNLVEIAINSNRIATLDTHVYPIIFLYRQFLELAMKSIYLSYSEHSMKEKIKTIKDVNHDLLKVWGTIKPLIQDSNSKDDTDTVKVVEDYITQFHEFDKSSFRFRYPIDKKLNPVLDEEQFIDLLNLKQRMDELDNFFSGVDGHLNAIKESKYEQQREYLEYMQSYLSDIDYY